MKSERDQWIAIKRSLNSYDVDESWEQGFELFRKRILKKFIEPIDAIIELKNHHGEGFAIVTIQCALIETFSAFKYGKIYNHRYHEGVDPGYQYNDSREIFVKFLRNENIFEGHFWIFEAGGKVPDKPFSANDFYSNVRCALMHEGKTRKNWTINVKPRSLPVGVFLSESRGKKKIYRTVLQRSLKKYLNDYIDELRIEGNSELRKYFAREMDHLYQLKKNNLGWWNGD